MRGGTYSRIDIPCPAAGLSPHARGNLIGHRLRDLGQGPIPACAGEPHRSRPTRGPSGAYPRMRGGTISPLHGRRLRKGLSPHARGNLPGQLARNLHCGPIPACAGEPQSPARCGHGRGAYPRMRGGTKLANALSLFAEGLSPHARGNPTVILLQVWPCGPIPACAGEPSTGRSIASRCRAYPRMRGGTDMIMPMLKAGKGLSPHARGNPKFWPLTTWCAGPIPACAGEPG